jgi:hypothetical protein
MERTSPLQILARLLPCIVVFVPCACRSTRIQDVSLLESPGVLRAATSLEQQSVWQQRVIAHWGDAEAYGFDAVIQRAGESLTILGLSPAGSVGFSIVLSEGEVELVNNMPDDFPFPPRNVLMDVQRAFYPWLASGTTEGIVDGERIAEIWSEGKLVERTFSRLDGAPAGIITIRYEWGDNNAYIPASTVLENGWFDYKLEIETQRETLLDSSGEPE